VKAQVNESELIKSRSRRLRGTLAESLADELTAAIDPADTQIGKFHGFYQQDDRDHRAERRERWLEPDYSFMLRARLPGGICTPAQWLVIDRIGRELTQGSVRLTTRQTFQYHGIAKQDLRGVIQGMHQALLDSIGGCGDINRNVIAIGDPAEPTRLLGFNCLAGGGMGTTHGDRSTFPRLSDELGFVPPEQVLAVAEAVVTAQRDFGDREDRTHARLKYTILPFCPRTPAVGAVGRFCHTHRYRHTGQRLSEGLP
jgi:sulfite reductase beta subunit-like hemoprotein